MRVSLAGLLILLAAGGCSAPKPKGPCEGLVYTDAGLTREQYAPCATAMVAKLDLLWDDLQALHDKTRSKADRLRARQHCMAAPQRCRRPGRRGSGKAG
jgi:hypothetical protein